MTAAPSFLLKIIYTTHAESGGVLARHISEDTLAMIRAWLSAIKECADDERVKKAAEASGYVCLGVQIVLIFVDLYLAAPEGADGVVGDRKQLKLSIAVARMPPVTTKPMLRRE